MKILQYIIYLIILIIIATWLHVNFDVMFNLKLVNLTALVLFNLACAFSFTFLCYCMYRSVKQEKLLTDLRKEEELAIALKKISVLEEGNSRKSSQESMEYERIKKLFEEIKSIETINTPVTVDDQIKAFDTYYKQAVKTYELIKQTLNK